MDYSTLPERLGRIENLSKFAEQSGLTRRHLQRIAKGHQSPSLATCAKIEQKLKEIKPKMRPKARPEAAAALLAA
jgi:DNA-binding phage protein